MVLRKQLLNVVEMKLMKIIVNQRHVEMIDFSRKAKPKVSVSVSGSVAGLCFVLLDPIVKSDPLVETIL